MDENSKRNNMRVSIHMSNIVLEIFLNKRALFLFSESSKKKYWKNWLYCRQEMGLILKTNEYLLNIFGFWDRRYIQKSM